MELGMVGLGRMGANMTRRLIAAGHRIVVFDRDKTAISAMIAEGAIGADSLEAVAAKLAAPRAIWIMVPSGDAVDETLATLLRSLQAATFLSMEETPIIATACVEQHRCSSRALLRGRRHKRRHLGTEGRIHFDDRWGCRGSGPMRPIFEALAPAPNRGWAHMGPSGAGHFAKWSARHRVRDDAIVCRRLRAS